MGQSTWIYWAIDTVGVIVLIATAHAHLLAAQKRRPNPSRLRAFGTTLLTTTLALVAANVVRMVLQTFLTDSPIVSFAGFVLATVLVSAVAGIILGVFTGTLTAALPRHPAGASPLARTRSEGSS